MDDLAQGIERRQMLLPVMIEGLQQEVLFDLDPVFGRQLRRLGVHHGVAGGNQPFDDDFRVDRGFLWPVAHRQVERQGVLDGSLQLIDVPLFRIGIGRAVTTHNGVDRLVAHIDDDIADGFAVHDVGALFVNDLALVVHHIVVLQQLLADIVVARLDFLLRGLDGL